MSGNLLVFVFANRNRNWKDILMAERGGNTQQHQQSGKAGGTATAENHDRAFYEENGRKGGEKVSQERGPEFYKEIGQRGGTNSHGARDQT